MCREAKTPGFFIDTRFRIAYTVGNNLFEGGDRLRKRGIASFCVAFSAFGLLLLAERRNPTIALAVDRYLGAPLRAFLSSLSARVDVSVSEWLLLSLPVIFAVLFFSALFAAKSARATVWVGRLLLFLLLLVLSVYVLAFAPGEYRPPLAMALGLSDAPPTAEEVISCVAWLSSLSAAETDYPGADAVTEAVRAAFFNAAEKYGFFANGGVSVKETSSPLFLRRGYFGLYAFLLGEITLTSDCPDATRAFTLAHEMAHSSGFAREEEADIVAFLACLDSEDAYLTAAAATGMLGRVLCVLYEASPPLWERASALLTDDARSELFEAGEIYEGGIADAVAPIAVDYGETVKILCAVYRALA